MNYRDIHRGRNRFESDTREARCTLEKEDGLEKYPAILTIVRITNCKMKTITFLLGSDVSDRHRS